MNQTCLLIVIRQLECSAINNKILITNSSFKSEWNGEYQAFFLKSLKTAKNIIIELF